MQMNKIIAELIFAIALILNITFGLPFVCGFFRGLIDSKPDCTYYYNAQLIFLGEPIGCKFGYWLKSERVK